MDIAIAPAVIKEDEVHAGMNSVIMPKDKLISKLQENKAMYAGSARK
jgi:hypothetical protein